MIAQYLTLCCSTLNQYGSTAVHQAASKGHASVVTLLLDANADVNHAHQVRYTFSDHVYRVGLRTIILQRRMLIV